MRIEEVILSSYVNLYRNWDDYPFPCRNQEGAFDCLARVMETLPEMKLHMVSRLSEAEQEKMLSEGSMTRSLLRNQESGAWCSDGKNATLLFNDMEHISILTRRPGLALEKCAATANEYEKRFEAVHPFLTDEKLGFLASWLPHIGVGMEAGTLCHLPCLKEEISRISSNLNDLGMALEPLPGAEAPADLYRLRHLPSLTLKAEEQRSALNHTAHQLYEMEKAAREQHREETSFQDQLWRSYALLSHARLMESREFLSLWSQLRLGAAIKLLPVSLKKADALYHLGLSEKLTPEARAELVRNELKKGRNTICPSLEDSPRNPKKL